MAGNPINSAVKYLKRGFVLELIGIVVGFLTGIFVVGLASVSAMLIVVVVIFLIPLLLMFYGWLITWIVNKIN